MASHGNSWIFMVMCMITDGILPIEQYWTCDLQLPNLTTTKHPRALRKLPRSMRTCNRFFSASSISFKRKASEIHGAIFKPGCCFKAGKKTEKRVYGVRTSNKSRYLGVSHIVVHRSGSQSYYRLPGIFRFKKTWGITTIATKTNR